MYKFLTIVACILLSINLHARNYSAQNATDSLRQNALAIVENFEAVFTQTDLNNGTYKESKTITILNKQGESYANFYISGDKFRELKDFSGVIKNVSGTVIKKISKKDLIISSMSEHMATDSYSIIYECKVPTFPYTIEYTYQEKWKNGVISYPRFSPIEGYLISVKNANYKIELPANMNLRYDSNLNCTIKDEIIDNKHIYNFSAKNLKAIEREPLSPSSREVLPRVLIAPSDFCYDSFCGNMSTWKDYGLWVSKLLEGRDVLPETIISKVQELTKDAKTDKEKVEILYNYLQNNSRYVSIQLGIGGLQPIEAASVIKSGFGDCKGLSNQMKALLKVIGIPSNYCEISMKEKDLHKNFCNVNQTDHAILLVPLKNDSVWLECTSQTLPFGYIHDNIAGHDALIISENGGEICRLPTYSDQENKTISKIKIDISEDGSAKGNISFTEYLHAYASNMYHMASKDKNEQIKYINKNVKFPKIQIDNIEVLENKSAIPSCILSTEYTATDFANKTGTRLFIPICPLNKEHYNVFSSKVRNLDIEINNGFSESDTIIINMPESYTTESLPKNISLKGDFGILETQIKEEGNSIIYTQHIDIYSGKYDKSKYEEIKDFFTQITSATRRKLVLKKL